MQTYLKIVDFLEAHIELVKVFLYTLSPVVAVCFSDFRAAIVKFLNGLFFIIAFPVRNVRRRRKRKRFKERIINDYLEFPHSSQTLLLRFVDEGEYIEVTVGRINYTPDVKILEQRGWIRQVVVVPPILRINRHILEALRESDKIK